MNFEFDYDAWLEGKVAEYYDKPDPEERYSEMYRVHWFEDDKQYAEEDYTEKELRYIYENDNDKVFAKVYQIIEYYYYVGDGDIKIIDTEEDFEPVYVGMI